MSTPGKRGATRGGKAGERESVVKRAEAATAEIEGGRAKGHDKRHGHHPADPAPQQAAGH